MKTFDVIIVGNGAIGYSTAFALSVLDPQLKIAVIGPKQRIGGATIAAGAMINCFSETTSQTFQTVPNQTKFGMCHTALKMWPEWLEQINDHLQDSEKLEINYGTYVILNNQSGKLDTDNYHSIIHSLNTYKEFYQEIDPQDILEINPLQSCRPLRSLWIPGEGSISSHEVMRALENILNNQTNVSLIFNEVKEVKIQAEKINGVLTEDGQSYSAEKIVIATGAFSQELINQMPELRKRIPIIFSGVGCSILVEQNPNKIVNHVVRSPNRAGACGLHVLPRDDKTLYIGASNDLAFYPHTSPKLGMLNFLGECALKQIDQELCKSKFLGWAVGNRPATLDSFPLIGELSVKNLFLLTGTYRDGFHQSPLLSQHMALTILGKAGLISDMFTPERPLIQVKNKGASIDEYVLHFMSSSYERNMQLPIGILTDSEYLNFIRKRTEILYDSLDTDFGLPPDVLFMFDLDSENKEKLNFFREYLQEISYKQAETVVQHRAEEHIHLSSACMQSK